MLSIVRKAEKGEVTRLAYMIAWTWMIKGRARPLGDCRNIVTESSTICLVCEHTKEGSSPFIKIWLELGLNLDNVSRSY